MNDNTDKLAAQMQNLRPSKSSKARGMDAAMAAFNQEFASDAASVTDEPKAASSEKSDKKIESTQGLTDAPRPTGQTTTTVRVTTRRVETMSKVKNLFNFKPQTMMMAGTCSAALIAAMIVIPNMGDLTAAERVAPVQSESLEADVNDRLDVIAPAASDEFVVTTGKRHELKQKIASAPAEIVETIPSADLGTLPNQNLKEFLAEIPKLPVPVQEAPPPAPAITSVDALLNDIRQNSAKVEGENRQRERHFRSSPRLQADLAESEFRQVLKQKDNIQLFESKDLEAEINSGRIEQFGNMTLEQEPAVQQDIGRQRLVTPPKYILRDDDGTIVREFESRDAFEIYKANLPTPVAEKPVSTFSVDVDTSSYSFLRASINSGKLPPRESIRLEEMINYFPYDYEAPKSADEPFKANVTVTSNPWNEDTKLMHIGIKGYVPKQAEKPRSNLVFLIDTSGSMNQQNKLPLLINSFKLLLNTLDENDTVSIVAYASASGTVLEPTAVKNKSEILAALNNLRAGGSTAGAAGLELAYQKAQESFDDEGVNRVILATDGDFNVGFSSPDDMKNFIQKKRKTGIFLSVLGFGMGNYNDHLMQSLAQNGNGVAAYIDNLSEANKVLANEAGSALFTIAKDVKIQVEFNPAKIAEYRLIGYETRALKRQDFNNDKVDAGEIGAGHSVTAIYEMTPVGSPAVTVDKLRYVSEEPKTSTGSSEYAFVKIRHKLPDADKSTLQTFPIGKRQERRLNRASDDMRFATAVAAVGQKLRGDTAVEDYSYADAIKLAKSAKGKDENGYRAEFIQMIQLIDAMEDPVPQQVHLKSGERRR